MWIASDVVDLRGIEPLISSMPWKRDNRYATGPWTVGESNSRFRNANAVHYHCANSPQFNIFYHIKIFIKTLLKNHHLLFCFLQCIIILKHREKPRLSSLVPEKKKRESQEKWNFREEVTTNQRLVNRS